LRQIPKQSCWLSFEIANILSGMTTARTPQNDLGSYLPNLPELSSGRGQQTNNEQT
jgi:hypothetical protein